MNDSGWNVLEIWLPAGREDLACSLLAEMGTLGVEIVPAGGMETRILAYFPYEPDGTVRQRTMENLLRDHGAAGQARIIPGHLPAQDWVGRSRSQCRPIRVGRHFLFHPSWEVPPLEKNRIRIQLDPQQAFGTGSHESTRLCIRLMERYYRQEHTRCLDAGCGSGILLIALAGWIGRCWPDTAAAFELVGIESDAASVTVARENLAINRVTRPVQIHLQSLETFIDRPYSFIFANLLSEILIRNMSRLFDLLAGDGTLIMSGILACEAGELEAMLTPRPWRVVSRVTEGDWTALAVRKDPSGQG